ncbi:MAG: ABC transporter substrate-binding protein, partial [Oscillospiraceae bacterium]
MKAIKLLFTLILILSILTACGNKSDKEITAEETLIHQHDIPNEVAAPKIQGLRLPYVVQLSSNPYTASIKANTDICSLIYDPLVKIKTDYTNEMYLAESISSAENVHTVTLKKGIAFSDGSILNADDAVNSFERAKAGDSFYSSSLAEVISCTKKDDYTIVFEAESIDENFANLLTFPIVKQKEDGEFIGCGRYKLNAQKNALIRNTSHFKSKSGIDKIDLVEFKSSSELINSLRRGEIDCIFTDTPDWSVSYISRKTSAVDMNKLVLLGINCQREQFSEGTMRQVILKAVDQQALIKDAFKSTAIPTSTPFNPAFYKLDSAGAAASTHAPNEIPKMMSELGFTEKDENGMYTGLSLNLIVNNESPIK